MQPRSRQVPPQPMGSRSTTAVFRPICDARMAPTYPPGPLPITTRSNVSPLLANPASLCCLRNLHAIKDPQG
jgi:hypothetical protein